MDSLITEQKVDEGIVPYNMGWRAGIGQQMPSRNDINKGIQNGNYELHGTPGSGREYIKAIPNKGELYMSLAGEINNIVDGFTRPYRDRELNDTDKIIIKSSISNKFGETIARHKQYMGLDFVNYYNQYTNPNEFGGVVSIQDIDDMLNNYVHAGAYEQKNQIMIND